VREVDLSWITGTRELFPHAVTEKAFRATDVSLSASVAKEVFVMSARLDLKKEWLVSGFTSIHVFIAAKVCFTLPRNETSCYHALPQVFLTL